MINAAAGIDEVVDNHGSAVFVNNIVDCIWMILHGHTTHVAISNRVTLRVFFLRIELNF